MPGFSYRSDARIDFLLDKTCEYVNMSPYLGYRAYVNTLTKNMQGTVFFTWYVPHLAVFIFALIVTIVFFSHYYQENYNRLQAFVNLFIFRLTF